jgi:hypothetical protein
MLKENPKSRPNIYQVLREACMMQGIEVPIKDVCPRLKLSNFKLIVVDLCRENTIGSKTESATPYPRQGRFYPSHRWSCVFTTTSATTGHSRRCTDAKRQTHDWCNQPCFQTKSFSIARGCKRPFCCIGFKITSRASGRNFKSISKSGSILVAS